MFVEGAEEVKVVDPSQSVSSDGVIEESDLRSPTAADFNGEADESLPLSSDAESEEGAQADDSGDEGDQSSVEAEGVGASQGEVLTGGDVDQALPIAGMVLPVGLGFANPLDGFMQRLSDGAQTLLITWKGEAPTEEKVSLPESGVSVVEQTPASKEISADHLLYGGAIVGFVAGPAIRCLSDYVSGDSEKSCMDHYYNTFSANNLLHVASSYVASSLLHAFAVAKIDNNDYFCKENPFVLGFAYTAGYEVLDLSVTVLKSGYDFLMGNSADSEL